MGSRRSVAKVRQILRDDSKEEIAWKMRCSGNVVELLDFLGTCALLG